jgi:predicted ATP-binding protein involved in virulence
MRKNTPNVSEETISNLEQLIYTIRQLDPSMQDAVVQSLISAFKQIYIICASLAGMPILLSSPMERVILNPITNNTRMIEQ